MENTFWIIISIYFLIITLLGFLLVFHFNRYKFRESIISFFFAISLLVLSIIIYNALRNTEFGKWVQSGRRGTRNLMRISFLLAFLTILPFGLIIYVLLSVLKNWWKKRRKKNSKKKV